MKYGKRKQTKTKRKPRSRYSNKVTLYKNIKVGGVPKSKIVKMRYVDNISINPSTSIASEIYRANSCFDPQYSLGGHQPMGFDQSFTDYKYGRVLGSKITVQCIPNNTIASGSNQLMFGVYLDNNATADYSGFTSYIESPRTFSWGYCGHTILPTGRQPKAIAKYSPRAMAGSASAKDDDQQFTGAADCERQFFYHIVVANADETTDPPAQRFMVTIEYLVKMTEPIVMTVS